jgi:UDP-N-acetyl-2-amino-2-deoxyglucuronate dehydrogenase
MVKKTKADCIVILTPNHFHFEMAKFSAQQGKIVLCEKPLALTSEEVKALERYKNIFTVFQLRYHPNVKKIKSEFKKNKDHQIEIRILVHRDENYWKSWKGEIEKSGGIIFNLGIHYFDLLLYLFGDYLDVKTERLTYKMGKGEIYGKNYFCEWTIDTQVANSKQERIFKINGMNYDFSSSENLHFYVYKDLLKGKGVFPKTFLKSIKLIERINGKKQ